jgi:hypothetical protein
VCDEFESTKKNRPFPVARRHDICMERQKEKNTRYVDSEEPGVPSGFTRPKSKTANMIEEKLGIFWLYPRSFPRARTLVTELSVEAECVLNRTTCPIIPAVKTKERVGQ